MPKASFKAQENQANKLTRLLSGVSGLGLYNLKEGHSVEHSVWGFLVPDFSV